MICGAITWLDRHHARPADAGAGAGAGASLLQAVRGIAAVVLAMRRAAMVGMAGSLAAASAGAAPPSPAAPATIRIGLQNAIAPYVMPGQQSGLLVDVLRGAFATQQAQAEFIYLPNVRMDQALRDGLVDVSTSAKPGAASGNGAGAVLSRWPVTRFHNIAITLRRHLPQLDSVAALAGLRVTAFRRARELLGPAYSAAVNGNPDYREAANMPSAMLLMGRTDVIISQRDIFTYYLSQQLPDWRARLPELAWHDVLGPANLYWLAFRTEQQRALFERGMAALYASGQIDRIAARYQQDYGATRGFLLPLDCRFRPAQYAKECKALAQQPERQARQSEQWP